MNIYILEDDLMQQTRISDIIRELVQRARFRTKLEVFLNPQTIVHVSTRRVTIRFPFGY